METYHLVYFSIGYLYNTASKTVGSSSRAFILNPAFSNILIDDVLDVKTTASAESIRFPMISGE